MEGSEGQPFKSQCLIIPAKSKWVIIPFKSQCMKILIQILCPFGGHGKVDNVALINVRFFVDGGKVGTAVEGIGSALASPPFET